MHRGDAIDDRAHLARRLALRLERLHRRRSARNERRLARDVNRELRLRVCQHRR